MQSLSYQQALAVGSLPTPSTALQGVTVRLTTDNKPYWCDGTQWVDLTSGGGGSGAGPTGATGSVQYKNGTDTFGGAARVSIADNDLSIAANSAPSLPAADNVKLFGKLFGGTGGRVMLAAMGPSGMDYTISPAFFRQNISLWKPPGNSTTVPGVFGFPAPTAVGTATARNVSIAGNNAMARARRLGYVSSTTAGSACGHYSTVAQVSLGDGTGLGGFLYSCRFAVSDAVFNSGARTFVGLTSSVAAPTNVAPGTLLNAVGIGHNAGESVWSIYYGGSTAQASISLGVDFTIDLLSLIELTLWSPPNQNGVVYYEVTRIRTSGQFTASGKLGPGTAGVTLPTNGTLLAHRAWRNNNNSATANAIDINSVYIETDW